MNTEALFLFLILLLGLVLCSFLGGNCNSYEGFTQDNKIRDKTSNTLSSNNTNSSNSSYKGIFGTNSSSNSSSNVDNYNHYNGSSSILTNGATFTEPNGGRVVVNTSSDGTQTLQVTPPGGGTPIIFNTTQPTTKESMTNYYGNNGSATKFYGPNGQTAVVIYTNDGQQAVRITDSNNNSVTYTSSGTAAVYSSETNTTYFGSTGSNLPSSSYSTAYTGNYSAGSITGPQGNTAGYVTGPQGNTVYGTNSNNNNSYGTDYYSTLPPGIPKSQIIPGEEDLYILKSQIVPPVCPVCPVLAANSDKDEEKCPPCPPCARCPEPSFDCKKVPNYNAINNTYLPVPVLNDFSTFGM